MKVAEPVKCSRELISILIRRGSSRLVVRQQTVDEIDPALLEHSARFPSHGSEDSANGIEGLPDRLRDNLHQVEILRVAGSRAQVQLVERRATTKGESLSQCSNTEDLHEGPVEDEIVLDLVIGDPGAPVRHAVT